MANYVVGTLMHDGKTFSHGETVTASDVGGEDNLKELKAMGTVVTTEPKLTIPEGETENSVPYDPRPSAGGDVGVKMETTPTEPTNVPKDEAGVPKTTQPSAAKAVTGKSGS